jgi:KaiC/GvpD/RAD55 family RecA-like ATPase
MRLVLLPSGIDWLDGAVGGFPNLGLLCVTGAAGTGKTTLALGYARAAAWHGKTCFLTSETPDAVLDTARAMLDWDMRPAIVGGDLTMLSYAPFFVNKVRSLSSVDAPLAELKELTLDRQIRQVIFDAFDPLLEWIEVASAKPTVRGIVGSVQSWGVSVLCTTRGTLPAASELARCAGGSIELRPGEIELHHAGWCNVANRKASLELVKGRGCVADDVAKRVREEETRVQGRAPVALRQPRWAPRARETTAPKTVVNGAPPSSTLVSEPPPQSSTIVGPPPTRTFDPGVSTKHKAHDSEPPPTVRQDMMDLAEDEVSTDREGSDAPPSATLVVPPNERRGR